MINKFTRLTIAALLLIMLAPNSAKAAEATAISWLSEDFENGTPEGWDIGMFYMSSGGVDDSRAMWSESFLGDDALITPAVDMGSNPTFTFDYKVNGTKFGNPEAYAADPANVKFRIEVSDDNGATWQTVYRIQPEGGDLRHVMSNGFAKISINLPQYSGKTCRIKIAIDKFLKDMLDYCMYIIDNVSAGTPPLADLQIAELSIPAFLKTGETTSFNVTVTNRGVTAIDTYTVTLADRDGNTLVTSGALTIQPSSTNIETLKWTPSQSGIFYVSATANVDNDTNPDNNKTAESTVRVYSDETKTLGMGQPSPKTDCFLPVNFYSRNNFIQSIYGANELGINATTITGLRYDTDFPLSLQSCPLSVWVGETEKNKFENTSDWVSIDKLTKVFDGQVFIDSERQVMEIAFNKPVEYHGGNLVVCFHRSDKDFFMDLNFYQDFDKRFTQHSLSLFNDDVNAPIDPAAPSGVGKLYDYVPVVQLITIPAKQGTVTETITDTAGKAIQDATVGVSGTSLSTKTDAEGKFKLNLAVGSYTLKISRPAYFDTDKQINISENATIDAGKIQLTRLNSYKVSGRVTNQNGTPIAGAKVSALGYFNYKVTTDAEGRYSFEELFSADGRDYTLSVVASGYENLSKVVDLTKENTSDFEMKNRHDRPFSVRATAEAGTVTVEWDEPMRELRYDAPGVEIFDYLGYQGWAASVIGTAFPANMSLKEIQWFTTDKGGTEHATVSIVVTELDEIGWPTRHVLKVIQDVPNKDNEWSSYVFDTPLECPNGFYVGLNYPFGNSNVDICLSRPTEEFPVIEKRFFACDDINFQSDERVRFVDLSPYYNGNLLIRATGIDHGDVDYNDYSNEQPAKKVPVADCRFSVYRVNGEEWTMIADDLDTYSYTDAAALAPGEYVYAVAVKYPTGTSKYRLSAPLTLTEGAIEAIETDGPEIVAIYSVDGRSLTSLPDHGICIVSYSNGTCKKIIVK